MRRADAQEAHLGELLERNMRPEPRPSARYRAVHVLTVFLGLVATSFVLVLGVHIGLAFAGAEADNRFTRFVTAWADAVDLGLHNVVTMASRPLQVAADHGAAALLWVLIGALVTTLVDRLLLPHSHRRRSGVSGLG